MESKEMPSPTNLVVTRLAFTVCLDVLVKCGPEVADGFKQLGQKQLAHRLCSSVLRDI